MSRAQERNENDLTGEREKRAGGRRRTKRGPRQKGREMQWLRSTPFHKPFNQKLSHWPPHSPMLRAGPPLIILSISNRRQQVSLSPPPIIHLSCIFLGKGAQP